MSRVCLPYNFENDLTNALVRAKKNDPSKDIILLDYLDFMRLFIDDFSAYELRNDPKVRLNIFVYPKKISHSLYATVLANFLGYLNGDKLSEKEIADLASFILNRWSVDDYIIYSRIRDEVLKKFVAITEDRKPFLEIVDIDCLHYESLDVSVNPIDYFTHPSKPILFMGDYHFEYSVLTLFMEAYAKYGTNGKVGIVEITSMDRKDDVFDYEKEKMYLPSFAHKDDLTYKTDFTKKLFSGFDYQFSKASIDGFYTFPFFINGGRILPENQLFIRHILNQNNSTDLLNTTLQYDFITGESKRIVGTNYLDKNGFLNCFDVFIKNRLIAGYNVRINTTSKYNKLKITKNSDGEPVYDISFTLVINKIPMKYASTTTAYRHSEHMKNIVCDSQDLYDCFKDFYNSQKARIINTHYDLPEHWTYRVKATFSSEITNLMKKQSDYQRSGDMIGDIAREIIRKL